MYLYHISKILFSFLFSFSFWLMRFSLKQTQLCLDDNVDKKSSWFSNRKKFSLRWCLAFTWFFFRCQLGVAYKGFAYKINVYQKIGTKHITKFKMFQLSVDAWLQVGIHKAFTWCTTHCGCLSKFLCTISSRHVYAGVFFYIFICFCCRFFETLDEEILKTNNINNNT